VIRLTTWRLPSLSYSTITGRPTSTTSSASDNRRWPSRMIASDEIANSTVVDSP
jgi:hypothetical protein